MKLFQLKLIKLPDSCAPIYGVFFSSNYVIFLFHSKVQQICNSNSYCYNIKFTYTLSYKTFYTYFFISGN